MGSVGARNALIGSAAALVLVGLLFTGLPLYFDWYQITHPKDFDRLHPESATPGLLVLLLAAALLVIAALLDRIPIFRGGSGASTSRGSTGRSAATARARSSKRTLAVRSAITRRAALRRQSRKRGRQRSKKARQK